MKYYKFHTHKHIGDHIIVTGAVRNICAANPEIKFIIPDLYKEIFLHNPDFDNEPITYTYLAQRQQYGSIFQEQHALCGNLVEGHTKWLCNMIGIPEVPIITKKPCLYLTARERKSAEAYKDAILINANCQNCSISKGYPYWQDVVNLLKNDFRLIQIGGNEDRDLSINLDGVEDRRGKTSIRRLMAMVYGCKGLISPPSCSTNIAGAFDKKQIVVNAGREPDELSNYENAKHISCVGKCGWGISTGCIFLRAGEGNRQCRDYTEIDGRLYCACQMSIKPERIAETAMELFKD